MRGLRWYLIAGLVCLAWPAGPRAYAQTVAADNFDDGVLALDWAFNFAPSFDFTLIDVAETGGLLRVQLPQPVDLTLTHNLRAAGGELTVGVDMVKLVGGVEGQPGGWAGLMILDESRLIMLVQIGSSWFKVDAGIPAFSMQELAAVGAPAGVNPALHRLSLTYDATTETMTYSADGVQLLQEPLPLREKLLAALFIGASGDTAEVVYDNFAATFNPAPLPVRGVSTASLGTVTELWPTAEDAFASAWRPDGKQVALYRRDSLCSLAGPCSGQFNIQVLDIPVTGPPRTIATPADNVLLVSQLEYSADGSRVFYTTRDFGTAAARTDGSGVDPLYPPNPTLLVSVKQHGDSLYFRRFGINGNELRRVAAAGDGTPLDAPGGAPSVDLIADSTLLVSIPDRLEFVSAVSPDGSMLVTTTFGGGRDSDVFLYTGIDRILQAPTADPATQPIASRDDPRVIPVSTSPADAFVGGFSFDQTKIYFTETEIGTFCVICVISDPAYGYADGFGDQNWERLVFDIATQTAEVLEPSLSSEFSLRPSPDGTLLIFSRGESLVGGPADLDGDGQPDFDQLLANLVERELVTATDGGEVTDGSGSGVFIPAGALDTDTEITVRTPLPGTEPDTSTLPPDASLALARDLGPDGLVFNEPVTIVIHYTDDQIAALLDAGFLETDLQIFLFDDATGEWNPVATAIDAAANTATAEITHFSVLGLVSLGPNDPPVANAGPDQVVECTGGGAATVTLDGTGSSDPDGFADIVDFEWREGATVLGVGATLNVSLPLGLHTITLTVTDAGGLNSSDTTVIEVVDTTPPTLTAPADVTIECTNASGTVVALGAPVADDACGGVTVTNDAPAAFPLGVTVVTWTATDDVGLTATATQTVLVTVGVEGFLAPLTTLVPEGTDPLPLPDKAVKQGRTLPLKLHLFCGATALTDADVAPPAIVALERTGEAVDLATIDPDAGEANDSGLLFRYSAPNWVYNLSTRDLSTGTYAITIEMPDGLRYQGAFVLR